MDGVFRRAGGEAYAGAGGEFEAAVHAEASVDEFVVKIGGGNQRFSHGRFGHHHNELVASVAETHIFGASDLFDARADAAKEFAADEMAVDVIHGFESVKVDEGEADGSSVTLAAFDLQFESLVEMADVVEAGGVVGDGELLDMRDVVCVFDGDSGVVAEDMEEGDGVIAHLACTRIENFYDALDAFTAAERHGDDGTDHAMIRTESFVEAGIVFRLRHDQSFGVFGDPASDAFADADAEIAE